MLPNRLYTMSVVLALLVALSARADYEAGRQAWDAGRTNEALAQWQASAAAGDPRAMLALGRLHLQGLGVLQDYVEAHKWFNLAASQGDAEALAERDALTEKMTPAQVAEAQALARAWRPDEVQRPSVPQETVADGAEPPRVAGTPAPTSGATSADAAEVSTEAQGAPAAADSTPAPRASSDTEPGAALEPECEAMEEGAECWKELADEPGCYVWDNHYFPEQMVTWSGPCTGGVIVGEGTLVWTKDGESNRSTGTASDGKRHGHWVLRADDGTVQEGPYVDDKRHGQWVRREADGDVGEGPYVDGKRHGNWVVRLADGTVQEGPYADGKKQGHWVLRADDGDVGEGPYVDGKRHGNWVVRFASGTVEEGPYADGKRQGHWVLRFASGTVEEGPYADGKRQGHWVERFADGGGAEGPYVDGKMHGHWVIDHPMIVMEGPYVDGKMHGHWVQRTARGDVLAGSYVDGKQQGRWLKLIVPFQQGAKPSCSFDEYDQGETVNSGDLARDECSALRHAGTAPSASPREDEASLGLEPAQRERIQLGLRALGFDPGPPDGVFGERTRHAIRLWQASQSNLATGYLDASSAQTLQDAAPEAPPPPTALLHPKCSDLPPGKYVGDEHAECWEEIKSRPGCYLWRTHYHSDQTTRWSGQCRAGVAAGHGTYSVSAGSEHPSYRGTGTLVNGKTNGRWVDEYGDGARYEGEYRDGKRHGRGTFTFANGDRYEGEFRDGKRHGRGTFTWTAGHRYEGEFRDARPHGHGTLTFANGNRYEGEWRAGCFDENGRKVIALTTRAACGFE